MAATRVPVSRKRSCRRSDMDPEATGGAPSPQRRRVCTVLQDRARRCPHRTASGSAAYLAVGQPTWIQVAVDGIPAPLTRNNMYQPVGATVPEGTTAVSDPEPAVTFSAT
jgi:hypothetical protein